MKPMTRNKKRVCLPSESKRNVWILLALTLIGTLAALVWWFGSNAPASNSGALATLNTRDVHALVFHPQNPDALFFGHHGGMMQSGDGGKSWSPLASLQQDAMSIAIPRSDANLVFIAGHNVLSASSDGGKTWRTLTTNLPGTDIHAFAVNPMNAREFYAFAAGFGLFTSADGGTTWTSLNRTVPPNTSSIALGSAMPQSMFLGSGQGLFKSGDGGITWTRVSTPAFQSALALALNDRNELFAATEQGVFKSSDDGATWTRLNVESGVTLALALSPSNFQRIAIVNEKGQVFRSDDGGVTWGK